MGRLLEVDYEKIFSPKTMANLKGKSGASLRQMLGDKNLMQTLMRSKSLLDEIVAAEEGYRDELEMVAAQMVTDAYPIIDYANIKIEAEIVGMDDLDIPQGGENEVSIDNTPAEAEKAKRRIINGITQGASIRGAFGFLLFREYLDQLNPDLVAKYSEILKLAFGIYDDENAIAMMLAMLAQNQKMQGGESEMEYDEENEQFVIKAKAICYPMLVHEIVKGLYEIVGTEGFGADKEKNKAIVGAVDKLSNEPRDLQYGKFIYDAINNLYAQANIDDARVRELFFVSVYKLGDDEFFPFIENAVNDELTPAQKNWATGEMRDIERDLKKDDTGLEDLDEMNLKQGLLAAGIALSSILGTPDTSKAAAPISISQNVAKSTIEKVVKGFEKEGYKIDFLEKAKFKNFEGVSEDDIKIELINSKIESAARLVMNEFIRVNKVDRTKTLFMANPNENKYVVIYIK